MPVITDRTARNKAGKTTNEKVLIPGKLHTKAGENEIKQYLF